MEYMRLPNGHRVAHVNARETSLLYRRIFSDKCYLRHGITLLPGDTVLDVGANIGMAVLFFKQHFSDILVHAFEPAVIPFSALAENMALHGMRGSCRQIALAEASGFREFTYYPQTTVMSGLCADVDEETALTRAFLANTGLDEEDVNDIVTRKYERQHFFVRTSTLSRELLSLDIDKVGLLKLDVEKSELRVLRGIADSDWSRFRQIVAEVHDINGRLQEFTDLLRTRSFDVIAEQEELLKGTDIYTVYAVSARCGLATS